MTAFRFSGRALRDLDEILDHVALRSGPERAQALAHRILDAVEQLAESPEAGHARPDLTGDDVLFWSVFQYLIAYRRTKPIEVVRLIHGARDPGAIEALLED